MTSGTRQIPFTSGFRYTELVVDSSLRSLLLNQCQWGEGQEGPEAGRTGNRRKERGGGEWCFQVMGSERNQ